MGLGVGPPPVLTALTGRGAVRVPQPPPPHHPQGTQGSDTHTHTHTNMSLRGVHTHTNTHDCKINEHTAAPNFGILVSWIGKQEACSTPMGTLSMHALTHAPPPPPIHPRTDDAKRPNPSKAEATRALVGSRISSGCRQSKKSHDHRRLGAFLQEAGARLQPRTHGLLKRMAAQPHLLWIPIMNNVTAHRS